jgi:hypothetical protein
MGLDGSVFARAAASTRGGDCIRDARGGRAGRERLAEPTEPA